MQKLINQDEKFFIAGANGMVGNAIKKKLLEYGYGLKENNGLLLTLSRKDLDLLNYTQVQNWFENKKPTIVIIAAAKVGGIYANNSQPTEFFIRKFKNTE